MLWSEVLPGRAAGHVIRLAERGLRAVVLDIEGTTTPIAFVHEVLFPFAQKRLAQYLEAHWERDDVREVRRRLAEEHRQELRTVGDVASYAARLMDRDRKSPGLKLLQGLIWEEGYRGGHLRGIVFDDVPASMRRWHESGTAIAIYSSGSELAQRLLFESTVHGDLTPLIGAFFDTAIGAKVDAASYTRIASRLDRSPDEILFVSDVMAELKAARDAGLAVVLSMRPGNPPQTYTDTVESVTSLDQIDV